MTRRIYDADGNPNWKGGMKAHPMIHRYRHMVRRCHDPRHKQYPDYGGRGITVCERWRADFWAYVADMGMPPGPDLSVDRIDNDAGYSSDNCRWATPKQQSNNQRARYGRTLTHCMNREGPRHALTPDNVAWTSGGYRLCKTCHERRRARKAAKYAEAQRTAAGS